MNKIFRKAIVLALAGSALLYVGCTKDYSGDIQTLRNDLEEYKTANDGQINTLKAQAEQLQQAVSALETAKVQTEAALQALQNRAAALETFQGEANTKLNTLQQNIKDLQKADEDLNAALEAAKARIKALEDNTYTKQEVDGKIQSVEQKIEAAKAWASETFATKATVAQIDEALGQLTGVVDGILTRLDGIDAEIAGLKEDLAGVKTTAETALGKANQALSETEAIRQDLEANYYKAAQVDAMLETLRNGLQAQIDAEVAAREAGDVKANERIDSLATVTKGIEDDLAAYKEQTSAKLLELEVKLNEEIINRMAFQEAQEAKNAALEQKDTDLETAIAAVDAAYKEADQLLNGRCDALAERCTGLEGRATELETKLAALREEFDAFKTSTENALSGLRNDLATEIQNREQADAAINVKITALENSLNEKYAELKAETAALRTDLENLNNYVDYLADQMYAYAARVQSVVFVPKYDDLCADLVSYTIGNEPLKKIVTATFEVQPAEAIVYIDSLIKANAVALAVKEVDSRAIDADEIVSDVNVEIADEARGRFTVEAFLDPELFDEPIVIACMLGDYDLEGVWAGNAIMSSYVGVKETREIDLTDGYVWYDEEGDAEMDDSLGVSLRIPYTEPATDSLVFNGLDEEVNFRLYFDGEFKTLQEVADYFYIDVLDITPVGEVDYWNTKDANANEMAENDPFELSDFAPETSLTTTKNDDGVVDPQYVHYTTARKEIFRVNGEQIAPYAFVGVEIVKNVVPAFATDTYEIPWSYVHPDATNGKSFEVDGATDFGKAIEGTYSNADENFTKGDEAYERDPQVEFVEFIPADVTNQTSGLVKFTGWAFEAEDANYVAKTERFETESDDYEIDVPFVLKKRAANRAVVIDLGEIAEYHPSTDFTLPMDAIVPAFDGQEEYFIGDAEYPYNCTDSLYSAYANEGSMFHTPGNTFTIDAIYVNGDFENKINEYGPYIDVNLAWDVVNGEDASVLSILAGKVPYGATIDVCGAYYEFGVLFDYVITFTTPECPYTLVLTPYDKFDPAKDRTIMVEGDDVADPALYTLQQMFYTKYLRVVDQAAYKEGTIQQPAADDIDGADLKVKFTYSYEDLAEFGAEATELERGAVFGADEVLVITDTPEDYGYLDFAEILTWGDYKGLKVTVKAELIENGVSIQTLEDFFIETEKPIELKEAGVIGADAPLVRTSGYPLEVNVAQKMVIGGILSRGENNSKYFVADPAVFGYMDNNVNQLTGEVCDFYQLVVEYDWDNITATLNGVEWDLHRNVDYVADQNILTLLADSGKGNIVINVPVRIHYYLDYNGARAVDSGVITINVVQI